MHRAADVESALAAALEALPWWTPWLPALLAAIYAAAVLGFALPLLTVRIAAGRFFKSPADLHWTERAARYWPVRLTAVSNLFIFPMLAWTLARGQAGPLSALDKGQLGMLGFICALPGPLAIKLWLDRRVFSRPIPLTVLLRDGAIALLVFYPNILLYIAVGSNMPKRFDAEAWALIAVAVAGTVLIGRGLGLRLASWLRLAVPASPRIQDIVAEVSAQVGVRPRKVWSLRWSIANAVAFPGPNEIAFTTGAESALSDTEIGAITAHELGHLAEPLRIRFFRAALRFVFLPCVLILPVSSYLPFGYALLLCLFAPLIALSVSQRLLRKMETQADKVAHAHEGDAGTYARALEKLHAYGLIPAVLKRNTHPSLWDRMAAAGVDPGYAKPAPPATARLRYAMVSGGAAAILLTLLAQHYLRKAQNDRENASLAVLVASGGSESRLIDLGDRAWTFQGAKRAAPFYWAAFMLNPKYPVSSRNWALAMAVADSCDRASQGLRLFDQPEDSGTRFYEGYRQEARGEIKDSIASCYARLEAKARAGAGPGAGAVDVDKPVSP